MSLSIPPATGRHGSDQVATRRHSRRSRIGGQSLCRAVASLRFVTDHTVSKYGDSLHLAGARPRRRLLGFLIVMCSSNYRAGRITRPDFTGSPTRRQRVSLLPGASERRGHAGRINRATPVRTNGAESETLVKQFNMSAIAGPTGAYRTTPTAEPAGASPRQCRREGERKLRPMSMFRSSRAAADVPEVFTSALSLYMRHWLRSTSPGMRGIAESGPVIEPGTSWRAVARAPAARNHGFERLAVRGDARDADVRSPVELTSIHTSVVGLP